MPGEFDKWWNCLKKHKKRSKHWLPVARTIRERNGRPIRYFTLCARAMIDVFMLARQDILDHDDSFLRIFDVVFCELDPVVQAEISAMLGVPGRGFPHRLEKLVLFKDNAYTGRFRNLRMIQQELEDLRLRETNRERLTLKEAHILFKEKFPFDFLNLDFCEYYYDPPDILDINDTVEDIFKLQRRSGIDRNGTSISIDEFALTVTCRFDSRIPRGAFERLEELVRQNQQDHVEYRQAVQTSRGTGNPRSWRGADRYDFFLSVWPKDLMRAAVVNGWQPRITDFLQYDRKDKRGKPYKMVCLVAKFVRNGARQSYLNECVRVLDPKSRLHIPEISNRSALGRHLLSDLKAIVRLRNRTARSAGRQELPNPES